MEVKRQSTLFNNVSSVGSATISTYKSDVVSLQVMGDFTTLAMTIEGRIDDTMNTWAPVAVFKLSDYSMSNGSISAAGLYEFAVEGLGEARARITSLTGNVTVVARSMNTGA